LTGKLNGRLTDPEFQGQIGVTNASVEGHAFDRVNGDIQASRRSVGFAPYDTFTRADTDHRRHRDCRHGDDFASGSLTAQLSVKNVSLAEAAHEVGLTTDAQGNASATVRLSGTARQPRPMSFSMPRK